MGALFTIVLTFCKSLGLRFWLYVLLALAVAGEQLYIYEKGNSHGQAVVKAADKAAYDKQAALDKRAEDKRKADAVIAEQTAQKKIADLQKQSQDDANTIRKLNESAKAKKAQQPVKATEPSVDDACNISDDELQFYKKLIDKANNS